MNTESIEITPEVERLAKRPYRVMVSIDPEDGYIGQIPEMPGLLAVGDTADEMFELIEDAKRAWIATALAQNRPVPSPRRVDIPISKSGRFMVRLAPPIHAAIAEEAEIHNISLNELVSTVLSLVVAKGFDGFVSAANRRGINRQTKATTLEERAEATLTLVTSARHDASLGEDVLISPIRWGLDMDTKRYYEAKKYAYSLDYSYGRYPDYHKALIHNVWSRPISKDEFMEIAKAANVNLDDEPHAKSEHPHPIRWWNVDLPDYVLIAKDGEEDNYRVFTTRDELMMQKLDEAYAEIDAGHQEAK